MTDFDDASVAKRVSPPQSSISDTDREQMIKEQQSGVLESFVNAEQDAITERNRKQLERLLSLRSSVPQPSEQRPPSPPPPAAEPPVDDRPSFFSRMVRRLPRLIRKGVAMAAQIGVSVGSVTAVTTILDGLGVPSVAAAPLAVALSAGPNVLFGEIINRYLETAAAPKGSTENPTTKRNSYMAMVYTMGASMTMYIFTTAMSAALLSGIGKDLLCSAGIWRPTSALTEPSTVGSIGAILGNVSDSDAWSSFFKSIAAKRAIQYAFVATVLRVLQFERLTAAVGAVSSWTVRQALRQWGKEGRLSEESRDKLKRIFGDSPRAAAIVDASVADAVGQFVRITSNGVAATMLTERLRENAVPQEAVNSSFAAEKLYTLPVTVQSAYMRHLSAYRESDSFQDFLVSAARGTYLTSASAIDAQLTEANRDAEAWARAMSLTARPEDTTSLISERVAKQSSTLRDAVLEQLTDKDATKQFVTLEQAHRAALLLGTKSELQSQLETAQSVLENANPEQKTDLANDVKRLEADVKIAEALDNAVKTRDLTRNGGPIEDFRGIEFRATGESIARTAASLGLKAATYAPVILSNLVYLTPFGSDGSAQYAMDPVTKMVAPVSNVVSNVAGGTVGKIAWSTASTLTKTYAAASAREAMQHDGFNQYIRQNFAREVADTMSASTGIALSSLSYIAYTTEAVGLYGANWLDRTYEDASLIGGLAATVGSVTGRTIAQASRVINPDTWEAYLTSADHYIPKVKVYETIQKGVAMHALGRGRSEIIAEMTADALAGTTLTDAQETEARQNLEQNFQWLIEKIAPSIKDIPPVTDTTTTEDRPQIIDLESALSITNTPVDSAEAIVLPQI